MIRYWIFSYFLPPNANVLIVSIGRPTIRKNIGFKEEILSGHQDVLGIQRICI